MAIGTRQHAPRGPDPNRSSLRRALSMAAWPALAIGALALVALTLVTHLSSGTRHTLVVASMPYWNIQHDTAVVLANRKAVNEVSPWIYGLSPSGAIVPQYGAGQAGAVTGDIARLRTAGLRIVPSIANITGGKFAHQPIARILHSPALARQQVAAIVALVDKQKYAGIDIDYEELQPADQKAFTQFIAELSTALHARGKVLSVAVFPQTSAPGSGQANSPQDYAAIGKVADQVRIMGYNYHWAQSPPGAVAPITWVKSVLKYALSQMPASKVVLGIPLFGYNWADGPAQTVSWLQALQMSRQYGVPASYSKTSQAPSFRYASNGRVHTVWFENAASSRAKFDAVKGDSVAGVYLWMYGYEDPGTWTALRTTLPTSGAGASSSSPAVP
jgi:spore germination protein